MGPHDMNSYSRSASVPYAFVLCVFFLAGVCPTSSDSIIPEASFASSIDEFVDLTHSPNNDDSVASKAAGITPTDVDKSETSVHGKSITKTMPIPALEVMRKRLLQKMSVVTNKFETLFNKGHWVPFSKLFTKDAVTIDSNSHKTPVIIRGKRIRHGHYLSKNLGIKHLKLKPLQVALPTNGVVHLVYLATHAHGQFRGYVALQSLNGDWKITTNVLPLGSGRSLKKCVDGHLEGTHHLCG